MVPKPNGAPGTITVIHWFCLAAMFAFPQLAPLTHMKPSAQLLLLQPVL